MQKNIRLIALFNFFTDFSLYGAILVIYFAQVTGSYIFAMSLYSVTMVASALFEVPTGVFSDFLGRKKTMIAGAICSVLSVMFYAIGTSYLFLFIGALLEGLQRAWYSGNNEALLYETLQYHNQKDDYDNYLGKTSSMFQIAAALAIILGGVIATQSFALVMWLSVIPRIICLYITTQITEPKLRLHQSTNIYAHLSSALKTIWANKKLRLLSLNSVYGYAISESTFQFRSAFVHTLWPIWAVGLAQVLSNFGAAISYWFSAKVIKRYGSLKLILIDKISSKIIDIFSLLTANIFSPIIMSTTSLLFGVTEVANSKLMQQEFTDSERATSGSITSFASSFAFGIFAIFLGFLADQFGPTKALLIAYFLSIPNVYISWDLFKNHQDSQTSVGTFR